MSPRLISLIDHCDPPAYPRARRRVVLIHGIHTPEGSSNVRRLFPYFADMHWDVAVFEYGFISALAARWRNPAIADHLAQVLCEDDHVVAHSNGAALLWLATQRPECPWLRHASLIAPALDATRCPRRIDTIDVYHNASDRLLGLARLLPAHAWGAMGRDGASCGNAVTNFDTLADEFRPKCSGHTGYFSDGTVQQFGARLAARHFLHR